MEKLEGGEIDYREEEELRSEERREKEKEEKTEKGRRRSIVIKGVRWKMIDI